MNPGITSPGHSPAFQGRFSAKKFLESQRSDATPFVKSVVVIPIASVYAVESSGILGLGKYFRWSKKEKTPSYQAFADKGYSVLKRHYMATKMKQSPLGNWLGYKIEPKQEAQKLCDKLWKAVCEPLLNDPAKGAEIISGWEAAIEAKYPQHMVRDAGMMGLFHLKKKLDKPEAIRKAVYLVSLVMTHGGYEKMEKLLALSQSEEYLKSTRLKQQQMLLEGLGAVFVKAFQTVSTLPGLFQPHIQETMEKLYEDLSPIPPEQIQALLEKSLGNPLDKAFDNFDMKPLKVGSIAEVHKATLYGEPVVVKIVKPGIVESMSGDLALLEPLVDLAQEMVPHFDIKELFEDFAGKLVNETNMRRQLPGEDMGESDRLKEMKEALKGATNAIVPKVYDTHTTKNVLTMEMIPGSGLLKYRNDPQVASGYLMLMLDMIFSYGYCQADPHPGNILFNPYNNVYGCIDAGLAYKVEVAERIDFAKTLIAIFSKDKDLITEALLKPGMEKHPQYKEFQEQLTASFPNLDQLDYKTTLKFLNDGAKVAHKLGLETKELNPLLWKTLFTAVAVAKTLDPSVNLSYPAVTRLAFLFLKNRDGNFAMSAAYKMTRQQVGKGWEVVKESVGKRVGSVGEQVSKQVSKWWAWGTGSSDDGGDGDDKK